MGYGEIYDAATDAVHVLRKQAAVACAKAAADILNESPATANHAQRVQWARLVIKPAGPTAMAERMVWKILENATIQAAPTTATDSDVQFVVNALVDTFAGEE